jgi:hypothetical protein
MVYNKLIESGACFSEKSPTSQGIQGFFNRINALPEWTAWHAT